MNNIFAGLISKALSIAEKQVAGTLSLLEDGCTIPFISRYRKEVTGGLDEVQIASISTMLDKLKEVEKRKNTILSTIEGQGKLTDELRKRIENSWDPTELEDIYMPFKPKRRTRAEAAKEKGLEPLAQYLMLQTGGDALKKAKEFVNNEKGVKNEDEALKGAMDIIAETVAEDEHARNAVRSNFRREAVISSKVVKGKEAEGQKYRDYFDFSEPLARCASHRLLALRRGEA